MIGIVRGEVRLSSGREKSDAPYSKVAATGSGPASCRACTITLSANLAPAPAPPIEVRRSSQPCAPAASSIHR
jgi:hypothetical protein